MMAVKIRLAETGGQRKKCFAIRDAVFGVEQKIPRELDFDGKDAEAVHAIAFLGKKAVGTARMTPDGKIGRVAVLEERRGQGIAKALMRKILQVANDRGLKSVYVHAQTQATRLYEGFGFAHEGKEFIEAGIPHKRMVLRL